MLLEDEEDAGLEHEGVVDGDHAHFVLSIPTGLASPGDAGVHDVVADQEEGLQEASVIAAVKEALQSPLNPDEKHQEAFPLSEATESRQEKAQFLLPLGVAEGQPALLLATSTRELKYAFPRTWSTRSPELALRVCPLGSTLRVVDL